MKNPLTMIPCGVTMIAQGILRELFYRKEVQSTMKWLSSTPFKESLIKGSPSDWCRFFVLSRRQTGRRVVLCGGFADEERGEKMRQDDGAEFISASSTWVHSV